MTILGTWVGKIILINDAIKQNKMRKSKFEKRKQRNMVEINEMKRIARVNRSQKCLRDIPRYVWLSLTLLSLSRASKSEIICLFTVKFKFIVSNNINQILGVFKIKSCALQIFSSTYITCRTDLARYFLLGA